jgi:hypothetical protein
VLERRDRGEAVYHIERFGSPTFTNCELLVLSSLSAFEKIGYPRTPRDVTFVGNRPRK